MNAPAPFDNLPRGHFGAIYADPPWHFQAWATLPKWNGEYRRDGTKIYSPGREPDYSTMRESELGTLPLCEIAADNAVLFLWVCWPTMPQALRLIEAWGFSYKSCAFSWIKARTSQIDMFRDDGDVDIGLGYWTRANSEVCLLATRGKPKRVNADVRQGIIEPRREHSRKPSCVYDRIERLVAGPYVELFARTTRKGWSSWGNEVGKFAEVA
jgi:N6-adenosine-specific RNA methylase IME4